MIERKSPRVLKARPHFLKEEILGTDHWFRLPFSSHLLELYHAVSSAGLDRVEEGDIAVASAVWDALGAVIGACWHNETKDLETDRRDFDSLQEYGAAVLEELHDEGYSSKALSPLFESLFPLVVKTVLSENEVEDRVNFTEAGEDT